MDKILNKEELEKLIFDTKCIGIGGFGQIKPIDYFNLAKIYHRNITDSYLTGSIDEVIASLERLRITEESYKSRNPRFETQADIINKAKKRLKNTMCSDLVRGVIYYDDKTVGSILKWYKGYESLSIVNRSSYSREEYIEILSKLK